MPRIAQPFLTPRLGGLRLGSVGTFSVLFISICHMVRWDHQRQSWDPRHKQPEPCPQSNSLCLLASGLCLLLLLVRRGRFTLVARLGCLFLLVAIRLVALLLFCLVILLLGFILSLGIFRLLRLLFTLFGFVLLLLCRRSLLRCRLSARLGLCRSLFGSGLAG